jgi:hypothetical protein
MLIPDTASKKIMENIFESFKQQFEKIGLFNFDFEKIKFRIFST